MGTTGLVAATGATPSMLAEAVAFVEGLEAKWSRFRADSELSLLAARAGAPTPVSPESFTLIAAACAAWRRTEGAFDPTVGDAMVANGYSVSFDRIGDAPTTRAPSPAPGCADIRMDDTTSTVSIPAGVRLDAGGIGKGLAADLVSAHLIDLGASGALVDLGGDVRCRGAGPADGLWVIDVEHPFQAAPLTRLALTDGAVVTSSTQRRRWGTNRAMHHIVDPRTGNPTATSIVAATIVAGDGAWAEPLATAVIVRGDLSLVADAEAIAVLADGRVIGTSSLLELCA
jgi:thiamine biosynthesis lipoprotein